MGIARSNAVLRVLALVSSLLILSMLVATSTEAAKIETFNGRACSGSPTYTFIVGGNTCQTFNDQSAVLISDISSSTRVSVHNQKKCEANTMVSQIYGPGCVVQGHTALRAVWIQG